MYARIRTRSTPRSRFHCRLAAEWQPRSSQAIAHLVENFIKVRPGAIHLVYKGYPRHPVPIRLSPYRLIAAAPPTGRTPQSHHLIRASNVQPFRSQTHNNVDLMIFPTCGDSSGSDCDPRSRSCSIQSVTAVPRGLRQFCERCPSKMGCAQLLLARINVGRNPILRTFLSGTARGATATSKFLPQLSLYIYMLCY